MTRDRVLSALRVSFTCAARFLLLKEERKTEKRRRETRAKKEQTRCVVGNNAVHRGPVWAWRRVYEERRGGDGRARSRSSVGHWDVARGRDECGSHLQSVPVGQENHLWARRIRTRERDVEIKKKKRRKIWEREKACSGPDEDHLTRVVGVFPSRSVHSWVRQGGKDRWFPRGELSRWFFSVERGFREQKENDTQRGASINCLFTAGLFSGRVPLRRKLAVARIFVCGKCFVSDELNC